MSLLAIAPDQFTQTRIRNTTSYRSELRQRFGEEEKIRSHGQRIAEGDVAGGMEQRMIPAAISRSSSCATRSRSGMSGT
jgi:hypothetical protein